MKPNNSKVTVDGVTVVATGRFPKLAKLQSEYYTAIQDPASFISKMQAAGLKADVLTFVQEVHDRAPKYDYPRLTDHPAVMPVSTYDHWFNKQLYFKPRNKLRKAQRAGVVARVVEFSDSLVQAIKLVYDETTVRQGKPNKHFGKDVETLKREHSSFLDRSEFIGVFLGEEMIGFAKIVYSPQSAVLMNIVSMVRHRDKAPTNALVGKAVELCAQRKIPFLQYSFWTGQGLNDFKGANGFECFDVPRYFVPLTLVGRCWLGLGMHRKLKDRLPKKWVEFAIGLRNRMNAKPGAAAPQSGAEGEEKSEPEKKAAPAQAGQGQSEQVQQRPRPKREHRPKPAGIDPTPAANPVVPEAEASAEGAGTNSSQTRA